MTLSLLSDLIESCENCSKVVKYKINIQIPVYPKGNQSWIFTGYTDAEAKALILWATWCEDLTHWKRPWCWERLKAGGQGDDRGWDGWMTSPVDGHEFEKAPGVSDRQGSLACCSPWDHKESDTTERLNWNWHTNIDILPIEKICWSKTLQLTMVRKSETYLRKEKGNGKGLYEEAITDHKWAIWINRVNFRNISKNRRVNILKSQFLDSTYKFYHLS